MQRVATDNTQVLRGQCTRIIGAFEFQVINQLADAGNI
jgi:hypothetical protein